MRYFTIICIVFVFASCARLYPRPVEWYPKLEPRALERSPHVDVISGLAGYRQTTDYTCGPAAMMALAAYYGVPGISLDRETEMRVAAEAGARNPLELGPGEKPGLSPEAAAAWLNAHGVKASVSFEERGDYSGLAQLRANIRNGIPCMVLVDRIRRTLGHRRRV